MKARKALVSWIGACLVAAAGWSAVAEAADMEALRCIAPAKAGGGFDLTCQLTRDALHNAGQTRTPLELVYQPGGIGALAFKSAVHQNPPDGRTVIAFSSGTLLNLAQRRFGPYRVEDVRWLAALGMDHGVIAVRKSSPYKTLGQLMEALRSHPRQIVLGAGGSIGSQDWMKAALLARYAGVSHKTMRFVAFEGGGDALAALAANQVHVLAADAAEVGVQIDRGVAIRVLAVLSPQRLGGRWSQVPTAREQGVDLLWPILRGLYMGPQVPERDFRWWSDALARAQGHAGVAQPFARAGMAPQWLFGPALELAIREEMVRYNAMIAEFGLGR